MGHAVQTKVNHHCSASGSACI